MPTRQVWNFRFETLSPTFLGGANPNEEAELRIPSLRGQLRDIYRLLVGPEVAAGLRGHPPSLAESTVFGGTSRGEGQGLLVLSLVDGQPIGRQPWDTASHRTPKPGLAYLGFSLDMRPNDRKALSPNNRFTLQATFPRGLKDDQARALYGTFWLWAWLGGMGSRSRRGFGSVVPTRWPPDVTDLAEKDLELPVELPDLTKAKSIEELSTELSRGIRGAMDIVDARPRTLAFSGEMPVYRLDKARVVVWGGDDGKGWQGPDCWKSAMDAIGVELSKFRKQPGIDRLRRPTLRMLGSGERLPHAPYRTAFGLPLEYRKKADKKGFVLEPLLTEVKHRMPSPLLISLARCNGNLFVILTLLSGDWPGRDVAVHVRLDKESRGSAPADRNNNLPDLFLNSLLSASAKEVSL